MGRLEAYKDPGPFFGKGNLRLEFTSVGLQDTELPVSGKLITVRGYRVNRQGEIVGHGHPTRDAVEWLLPLWPWKVLTLPARGPRPTFKGEVSITLRLMDTVVVAQVSDSSGARSRQILAEQTLAAIVHEAEQSVGQLSSAQHPGCRNAIERGLRRCAGTIACSGIKCFDEPTACTTYPLSFEE